MAVILALLSLVFISFSLFYSSVWSCEFVEDPFSINSTVGATINISCTAKNCGNKGIRVIKGKNDITNDCGDPCNGTYCHFICTLELTSNDNGDIVYCQSLDPYVKSKEAILEIQSYLDPVNNINIKDVNESIITFVWSPPFVLDDIIITYMISLGYINDTPFIENVTNTNTWSVKSQHLDHCRLVNISVITYAGTLISNTTYWTGSIPYPPPSGLLVNAITKVSELTNGNVSCCTIFKRSQNCPGQESTYAHIYVNYTNEHGLKEYIVPVHHYNDSITIIGECGSSEFSLFGNDYIYMIMNLGNMAGVTHQNTIFTQSTYEVQGFDHFTSNDSVECFQCYIINGSNSQYCYIKLTSVTNDYSNTTRVPKDVIDCHNEWIPNGTYNICVTAIQPTPQQQQCDVFSTSVSIYGTVIPSPTVTPTNSSGFPWIYIVIAVGGVVGAIVLILVIVLTLFLIYYIQKRCKKRPSIVTSVVSTGYGTTQSTPSTSPHLSISNSSGPDIESNQQKALSHPTDNINNKTTYTLSVSYTANSEHVLIPEVDPSDVYLSEPVLSHTSTGRTELAMSLTSQTSQSSSDTDKKKNAEKP